MADVSAQLIFAHVAHKNAIEFAEAFDLQPTEYWDVVARLTPEQTPMIALADAHDGNIKSNMLDRMPEAGDDVDRDHLAYMPFVDVMTVDKRVFPLFEAMGRTCGLAKALRGGTWSRVELAVAGLSSSDCGKSIAGPVVRCHYTPLVASGRVSCSSPNLQQVPRDGGLRENVVPREGHVFVIADYKTLELCTLAQFCLDEFGESHMADLLQQGLDLHLNVAAKLLGITYEEALARKDDPEIKEHRRLAKGLNFGLPGGLGPDALVQYLRGYDFDIDRNRAAALKNEWLESYPEMTKLFGWAQRQVRNGLATITQPRSGRLRGGTKYTATCNTVFQGLASDGAKEALWRVVNECRTVPTSLLYGSHPVIFVHDEIVLEAPAATYQAAASRLEEVMVEGMRVFTPNIPIKVDVAAADCWSKEAQHLVDSNGDLLVWRYHG